MSILSGFKKVRRHIRLPDGYKLLSFWTSSQTVEMDDGTTLESNKEKWDDSSNKKHEHTNKPALDSITSEKVAKWNTLAESNVTGVKGNAEPAYRTGNVNISSSDVGAISKSGDTMTGDLTAPKFHGHLDGTAKKASALVETDTRNENKLPSWYQIYYPMQTITEFKLCHTIGLTSEPQTTGGYCTLVTIVPWNDSSGGYANQIAICNSGRKYTRVGQEGDNWSSWSRLITEKDTATTSVAGLTKLYTSTGSNTDGTMTRAAITSALNSKASTSHTHSNTIFSVSGITDGSYNLSPYLNTTSANGIYMLAIIPSSYYSSSIYIIYCYGSGTSCKQAASIINSSPSNASLSFGSSSTILTVTTAQGLTSDIRLIRLTH